VAATRMRLWLGQRGSRKRFNPSEYEALCLPRPGVDEEKTALRQMCCPKQLFLNGLVKILQARESSSKQILLGKLQWRIVISAVRSG